MTFDIDLYRFSLRAREPLSFSASGPANWLRGVFGSALRNTACAPDCPSFSGRAVGECAHKSTCAYARIFAPVSTGGPSGFANPPRPFVFRVSPLAGRSIPAGEAFCFELNFFDVRQPAPDHLTRAFAMLARAELENCEQRRISVALQSQRDRVDRLRVEFLTPTELKSAQTKQAFTAGPSFAALFARARDRVSTLRSLYGAGPLHIDFQALGERARAVKMTDYALQPVDETRRSRRSGQVHNIGGFTGWVEYEGELAEFLPILEAARWTGVGRHCVWGNGEILARPI